MAQAGTAVAAGSGARRTLILCPPHLTRKWKREAKIVWPECRPVILTTVGDVQRWLEQYGVLQEIVTAEVDESGKLTGKGRATSRTRELPGASPAMLPWLLNRTVFLSLMDLGFALPAYEEIPVTVAMLEEQTEQYEQLRDQLKQELNQRLQQGDNRLLGAYLAALLYWPDSPWRPELVVDPESKWKLERGVALDEAEIVAHVPGLAEDSIFPKEQAILDLVQKEKANGRRCVLYCQQTGIRDITPRWLDLFARHKLQAAVLKAPPDEREAWVEKQVQAGVVVIITHPKRVQTGLDLLDFPTLIWMGQEFSVYTVLQASRRSWRIDQTEPVKVYFFQYRDTLQDSAMRLIAAKVAGAIRVKRLRLDWSDKENRPLLPRASRMVGHSVPLAPARTSHRSRCRHRQKAK